jgi:tetrahydromethanopterin S-methyltransferase subunit G
VAVAIPFDTLDYAKKLETAGVPAAQAELQATALGDALAKAAVAPGDLAGLEGRLTARIESVDARIESLEAKMSARIDSLEAKMSARIDSLDAKIDAVKNELRLELGGQIARLAGTIDSMKWMFGFLAAMNIGILIRLFTTA